MKSAKATETTWHPEKKLLVTHIAGELEQNDIESWEKGLKKALGQMEANSKFRIFVNMAGFKAIDLEAHKRFRDIIPLTLADYGWKVGYLNLFEEEAQKMTFRNCRGISCVGAAHAHHDETKMDLYETKFSSEREHFFTDPEQALKWIETLEVD